MTHVCKPDDCDSEFGPFVTFGDGMQRFENTIASKCVCVGNLDFGLGG
jgi:hypothetical protein